MSMLSSERIGRMHKEMKVEHIEEKPAVMVPLPPKSALVKGFSQHHRPPHGGYLIRRDYLQKEIGD